MFIEFDGFICKVSCFHGYCVRSEQQQKIHNSVITVVEIDFLKVRAVADPVSDSNGELYWNFILAMNKNGSVRSLNWLSHDERQGMNGLSSNACFNSKEDTQKTYRPVVMSHSLVYHNTEVFSGKMVLYNRFMHINEMSMKVTQPSPGVGYCGVQPWHWEYCGLGPYEY